MLKDRLGRLPTVAEGVVYETVAGRHVFDSYEALQSWGKGGRIISCRADMTFPPPISHRKGQSQYIYKWWMLRSCLILPKGIFEAYQFLSRSLYSIMFLNT